MNEMDFNYFDEKGTNQKVTQINNNNLMLLKLPRTPDAAELIMQLLPIKGKITKYRFNEQAPQFKIDPKLEREILNIDVCMKYIVETPSLQIVFSPLKYESPSTLQKELLKMSEDNIKLLIQFKSEWIQLIDDMYNLEELITMLRDPETANSLRQALKHSKKPENHQYQEQHSLKTHSKETIKTYKSGHLFMQSMKEKHKRKPKAKMPKQVEKDSRFTKDLSTRQKTDQLSPIASKLGELPSYGHSRNEVGATPNLAQKPWRRVNVQKINYLCLREQEPEKKTQNQTVSQANRLKYA
jgi:hypothetical protein